MSVLEGYLRACLSVSTHARTYFDYSEYFVVACRRAILHTDLAYIARQQIRYLSPADTLMAFHPSAKWIEILTCNPEPPSS